MSAPEGRCGFVLEDTIEDFDDDRDYWYGIASAVCCWRESWNGSDTGQCFWHAEVTGKSIRDRHVDLPRYPERLDGPFLRGADFRDTNLSGTYLREADFSGASLVRAVLSKTEFPGADFTNASLPLADLSGSYLPRADFSGANLSHADLSNGNLPHAVLAKSDLSSADFTNAVLVSANVSGANLSEADLSDADLREANLRGVNLEYGDLSGANLQDADLSGISLVGADLASAYLAGADLSNANLWDTDLSDVVLWMADLTSSDFQNAILHRTDLTSITFSEGDPPDLSRIEDTQGAVFDFVDFSGFGLRSHDFAGARFRQTDFSGADLYKTNFEGTDLKEAIFDEADCRQARFQYADFEGASLIECDLRSTDLHGANLYQAALTDCKMNLSTNILDVFTYPPLRAEERLTRSLRSHAALKARRVFRPRSSEPLGTDQTFFLQSFGGEPVLERAPWRGRVDLSDWLARRVWTHQTIHRKLILHGRVREALREKHYLDEQRARLQRARLELRRSWQALVGSSVHSPNHGYSTRLAAVFWAVLAVQNFKTSYRLVRMSESPLYVSRIILLVAVAFALLYPLVGELTPSTAPGWGTARLPPPVHDAWRLFLFSLATYLEGTYLILKGTLGAFLPVEAFEPAGVSVAIVSGLEPSGLAASFAWFERLLGALLVVPFALLVVQRLRLYIGTAVSEEGLGGGLLSWLLGK